MNASFESCVTFTLVLVTFAVTMCQGQNSCHIHSRPHPSGLCGQRLTTAHQNLCFLLSVKYPELFSQDKRSESNRVNSDDRINKIPLSLLANLDLKLDNGKSNANTRDTRRLANDVDASREKTALNGFGEDRLTELLRPKDSPTTQLIRMLSKRSSVQKRNDFGMVCDCCINVCSPTQLATYC